jgi:hypothetical protein
VRAWMPCRSWSVRVRRWLWSGGHWCECRDLFGSSEGSSRLPVTSTFTIHADGWAVALIVTHISPMESASVLITGFNMSGKTTFVRALSVNAVLACLARWDRERRRAVCDV